MNDMKNVNQSNTQDVPGLTWDESAQQWLATHESKGKAVFRRHYPLINDAIAALKSFKSNKKN